MKKSILINVLSIIIAAGSYGVSWAEESASASPTEPDAGKIGYFFGYSFGNMLKQQTDAEVDLDQLRKGMEDALADQPPALTRDEQQQLITMLRQRQDELQKAKLKETEQSARDWLATNAKKEGVHVTQSGLQYEVVTAAAGAHPTPDDQVSVNYRGKTVDGKEFDSSERHGGPAEFGLTQVIGGWTEGLQLMSPGAKYRFYIPPELAYGSGGVPQAGIPPNAVLIFDVELLAIKPAATPAGS